MSSNRGIEDPLLESSAAFGDINDSNGNAWTGTVPFYGSAFNIMSITVGVGLLSIPAGVASAGWMGIIYIVVLGFMAITSGIMLAKSMEAITMKPDQFRRRYQSGKVTYSCVGHAAMGRVGESFVMLQVHMTLVGASIIFLILAGSFLQDLISNAPLKYHLSIRVTTLVCGIIASLHSFVRDLREFGFMSAFNVFVSLYLFFVICLEVGLGHRAHRNEPRSHVHHDIAKFDLNTIAAFSNFAYAFASHPCIPTIYNSMARPSTFPRMLFFSVCCIGLFYTLIGIVGYSGFGGDVSNPVLDSLSESPWKITAEIAFLLHVLMSFGLVVNAPESSIENELEKFILWCSSSGDSESTQTLVVGTPAVTDSEGSSDVPLSGGDAGSTRSFSWIRHLVVRFGLTTIVTGAAVYFSTKEDAFANVLGLVSSVTNTFTIFILPAVFYAKLVLPDIRSFKRKVAILIWILMLIIVGLGCAAIGSYTAIKNLFL